MNDRHRGDRDEDASFRITQKQSADIALAAAKEAVRELNNEMFGLLGYNLADLNDVKKLRDDIEFAHRLRVNSNRFSMAIGFALISIVITGLTLAVWEGIKLLARQ